MQAWLTEILRVPVVKDISSVLGREKPRLLTIALSLILMSVAQALLLFLIGPFIKVLFTAERDFIEVAALMPKQLAAFFPELSLATIPTRTCAIYVPVFVVVAGIVRGLSAYLYNFNQQALAIKIASYFRFRLFGKIIDQSFYNVTTRGVGGWMSILMNDVMILQRRLSEMASTIIKDSILIISCFAALSFIHWQSALILLLISLPVAVLMGRVGKRIAFFAEYWQDSLRSLAELISDIKARLDFILVQGGRQRETANFAKATDSYYQTIRRSLVMRASFAPSIELIGFMIFAGFLFWFGGENDSAGVRGELLLQLFGALGLILRPLRGLGEQVGRFGELKGTLKAALNLFESLDEASAMNLAFAARGSTSEFVFPPRVELKRIFLKRESGELFKFENLQIERGKNYAVIGPSGGGKSTLLRIFGGVTAPTEWSCDKPSWAEFVGCTAYVAQRPYFFKDSLRENLHYGLSSSDKLLDLLREPEWEAITEKMGVSDLCQDLDRIVDSETFSGGQLARLSILRSLLSQKSILLLDEATSSLEPRLEEDVLSCVVANQKKSDGTVIAVMHRLDYVGQFDYLVVVVDGQIKAFGNPHEVLASNGPDTWT